MKFYHLKTNNYRIYKKVLDKFNFSRHNEDLLLSKSVCWAGRVAEWLMAADCKSADLCLRKFESFPFHHGRTRLMCGCSLMVKLQPSKLITRVRFPSPAPINEVPFGILIF